MPPIFGTRTMSGFGCTQKPVRATTYGPSASANNSSVRLGTKLAIRGASPAGECATPIQSMLVGFASIGEDINP